MPISDHTPPQLRLQATTYLSIHLRIRLLLRVERTVQHLLRAEQIAREPTKRAAASSKPSGAADTKNGNKGVPGPSRRTRRASGTSRCLPSVCSVYICSHQEGLHGCKNSATVTRFESNRLKQNRGQPEILLVNPSRCPPCQCLTDPCASPIRLLCRPFHLLMASPSFRSSSVCRVPLVRHRALVGWLDWDGVRCYVNNKN
jgi:hypothetical protein